MTAVTPSRPGSATLPRVSLAAAITDADRGLLDAVTAVRGEPLTSLMLLLSAWGVKSLAIGAVGVAADLVHRPRRWPPTLIPVAVAVLLATPLASLLKDLAGRARPTLGDPGLTALTSVPSSGSMPSGHALTAFAAAGVVAALHPRLRAPVLILAAAVGLSRVYLGVHYPLDVLAGAALGLALAAVVVAATTLSPRVAAGRMRRWRSTPST